MGDVRFVRGGVGKVGSVCEDFRIRENEHYRKYHESLIGGHTGISRTYEL
jgi:hypothetical protein